MTLQLLPDTARAISYLLRQEDEVVALVVDRVWTIIPGGADPDTSPTFPLVRVTRLGGRTTTDPAYWAEESLLTVEAWASTRLVAWAVAETCRAVIVQRFIGAQVVDGDDLVIARINPGGIREGSAAGNPPAGQHRASFDVVVVAHPARP